MSVESPEKLELQKNAATQPLELTQALLDLDGEEQGGLTLTREHIITLKRYFNFAMALPIVEAEAISWLGYEKVAKAELMPASMVELFIEVHEHAKTWDPLSLECKQLAHDLGSAATAITTAGKLVLDTCAGIRKLGGGQLPWHEVKITEPVKLDDDDQVAIGDIKVFVAAIEEEAIEYKKRIEAVIELTETFRSRLSENLIPKTKNKTRAIEQYQSDKRAEGVKAQIADLDVEIAELQKKYDTLVSKALSGASSGLITLTITGGIFGYQAEGARKDRNRAQEKRRALSLELKELVKIDGAIEELAINISMLMDRLSDARAAANHLHTAWTNIGTYLKDSLESLDHINDTEKLLIFILHFSTFLNQWVEIKSKSVRLTIIFDQAENA